MNSVISSKKRLFWKIEATDGPSQFQATSQSHLKEHVEPVSPHNQIRLNDQMSSASSNSAPRHLPAVDLFSHGAPVKNFAIQKNLSSQTSQPIAIAQEPSENRSITKKQGRSRLFQGLEQANLYFRAKDYGRAAAAFSNHLAVAPKDAQVLLKRADCYCKLQSYDAAILDCDAVIDLNNGSPRAYLIRALCFVQQGDLESCLEDMSLIIQEKIQCLDPMAAELASELAGAGESKMAIDYLHMLRAEPSFAGPAYLCEGFIWLGIKDPDRALHCFDRAIELDQHCFEAYHQRVKIWLGRCEFGRAAQDLKLIIQNSNEPRSLMLASELLDQTGFRHEAATAFRRGMAASSLFRSRYSFRKFALEGEERTLIEQLAKEVGR